MKFLFSALLVFFLAVLSAGEITLDKEWRIVLPVSGKDPAMERHLRSSALLLRDSVKRATGLELPIVTEDQARQGKKRLFIGGANAPKTTGIALAPENLWEYAIVAADNDLYLFGNDRRWRKDGSYDAFTLGTVKAVTSFLEQFCGTDFLYPGNDGIAVRKLQKISVPDNLRIQKVPQILYGIGRRQEMFYDIANNMFPAPWYGTYGGHSHNIAIPAAKYAKEHPEYFALIKGKRDLNPRYPAYCLSRPEVQELIYRELLQHADKGYEMVQLAQSDGFRGCECEDCRKLCGISSWGEKLWIMHAKMAERFAKDRPGKLVHIIAYGPTRTPPQTFRKFPDNVVIELAPYTPEIRKRWKWHSVKNGFTAYLYNWGYYHTEGFTPKASSEFLTAQAADFRRDRIRGIYFCGFGELFGLEGPAYYQYLKQLEDPTLKAETLRRRYCQGLFGDAAPEMEKFYNLIDSRLQFDVPGRFQDWNAPTLVMNRRSSRDFGEPLRLLQVRWTPEVIAELDRTLKAAEKKNQSRQIKDARLEFDYLKRTAAVASGYAEVLRTNNSADSISLLKAVDARNRFIQTPRPKSLPAHFSGVPDAVLKAGGRMMGLLPMPFTLDAEWLLKENVPLAGRMIEAGKERSGQQVFAPANASDNATDYRNIRARISCRRDDAFLYVTFHFDRLKQEEIMNDGIQVYLGLPRQPETWKKVFVSIKSTSAACSRLVKTGRDNNGQGNIYEPVPVKQRARMTAPAPGCKEASVEIAVPFSWFGRTPQKEEKWLFNAAYQRNRRYTIWQYNLEQKSWRNALDAFGTIIFQ